MGVALRKLRSSYTHKYCPKNKIIILKLAIHQVLGTSKLDVALRILGVAPKVVEQGVALKVGEKVASHLTPLHAPVADLCVVLSMSRVLFPAYLTVFRTSVSSEGRKLAEGYSEAKISSGLEVSLDLLIFINI